MGDVKVTQVIILGKRPDTALKGELQNTKQRSMKVVLEREERQTKILQVAKNCMNLKEEGCSFTKITHVNNRRNDENWGTIDSSSKSGRKESHQCRLESSQAPSVVKVLMEKATLKFWYTNANSIVGKMDELRKRFESENADVIGIVETWATEDILDIELAFKGYNMYRKDRQGRKGCGAILYVEEK